MPKEKFQITPRTEEMMNARVKALIRHGNDPRYLDLKGKPMHQLAVAEFYLKKLEKLPDNESGSTAAKQLFETICGALRDLRRGSELLGKNEPSLRAPAKRSNIIAHYTDSTLRFELSERIAMRQFVQAKYMIDMLGIETKEYNSEALNNNLKTVAHEMPALQLRAFCGEVYSSEVMLKRLLREVICDIGNRVDTERGRYPSEKGKKPTTSNY